MTENVEANKDESIVGTDDNDVIVTGNGNDTIAGRAGDDELRSEGGNNFIFGEDGNDTLVGADGVDDLFGGAGDDYLEGGSGNDFLNGAEGNDTLVGGDGWDIYYNLNPGDVVVGGSGGKIDYDSLNLKGSAKDGSYEIVLDADNPENGKVVYTDADGNDAGKIVFTDIEQIIPCFTPGTRIATPRGEVNVESLSLGDRIITRDNGMQEIRWIGARDMSKDDFAAAAHLSPIRIEKGALGNDLPERTMMVSPNHRMLVSNDKTVLYFEESEVLVAAKHLVGIPGVTVAKDVATTYIHIMFDQHEVILSDGSWSESFQPGLQSLAGIGNAQRTELLELFPELGTYEGIKAYGAARRDVKAHEATVLVK